MDTKNAREGSVAEKMNVWLKSCIPYWKTGCIYDETILCTRVGDEICGELQYTPQEVLSISDYARQRTYRNNIDCTVRGKKIVLSDDSDMPWVEESILRGSIPSPYRLRETIQDEETDVVQFAPNVIWTESALIHGNQICVTYRAKPQDIESELFGEYGKTAPRFTEKVRARESVRISVLGDSVAEGCSASGHFRYAPFQPNWVELFASALKELAGSDAIAENYAVGGKSSDWGAEKAQVENCAKHKPHILFLHFGINDSGKFNANEFQKNIAKIYIGVKDISPATEVVLIKAAMPNPNCYPYKRFIEYWDAMDALASENADFYTVNMFDWSRALIQSKKYMDITGNGVNHPNDYTSRLYAMTLMNGFIPADKLEIL